MRRTRLSLAALVVASSAVLGLPTAALAAPDEVAAEATPTTPPAETTAPTAEEGAEPTAPGGAESTSPAVTEAPVAAEPSTTESSATDAPVSTEAPVTDAASAAETAAAVDAAAVAAAPGDIPVQLIAMNDFHGRISETSGGDSILTTGTGPGPDGIAGNDDDGTLVVGGAANVASTVDALEAQFVADGGAAASSLFVGAGDLISASPFNSSVFKDEPTIEVLNAMGLEVSSVGNHEFDRGTEELRRVSAATDGFFSDDVSACEGIDVGVDGCFGDDGHEFTGAGFPYLAANVVMKDSGQPMLPPFQVFPVGGGKSMALIGVVTDTTPTIVSPGGIADVEFIDEATAVNQWVPVLQSMGIQSIGVLIHEGGEAEGSDVSAGNGCVNPSGPILDINSGVSPAVDVIISAHTHQAYNCLLADPSGQPRLVTEAGFYGRLVTDIRLSVDPLTGDVDRSAPSYSAVNVPVTRDAPDADVQAIVDYWDQRSAEAGNEVIGQVTGDVLRAGPKGAPVRDAESPLGNLVAQAQLEALQTDEFGNPVVAFMNPGGLRTDLTYAGSPAGEGDGNVTYSELFNVQPFGNTVNAVTLTGADIKQVLEQQFPSDARSSTLALGTSAGFSYSYDPARPAGDRVDSCSITIDGQVVDPAGSYRVVANSFLVGGGDTFTAFTNGTDPATGPVDADTAVSYFRAHSPVSPPAVGHGTVTADRLDCGAPGGTPTPTPTPAPPVGGGGGAMPPVVQPVQPVAPVVRPVTGSGRSTSTGSLAYTGAPVTEMLGLGGLLLAAGVGLTAAGYRRRRGLAD